MICVGSIHLLNSGNLKTYSWIPERFGPFFDRRLEIRLCKYDSRRILKVLSLATKIKTRNGYLNIGKRGLSPFKAFYTLT